MRSGWVYIMTNAPFGTLYIGVTTEAALHSASDMG
jgi:predicted GIY-YIG superfamily endonuclease